MRILVVRLSALGDLVHTVPVVAALREGFPTARIDWLVDERFQAFVELVSDVDRCIVWPRTGAGRFGRFRRVVSTLRRERYDIAVDAQGLLKSAVAARLAGAGRVVGFEASQLREPAARWLHTEHAPVVDCVHVIEKNLSLASHLGLFTRQDAFPLSDPPTNALAKTRTSLGLAEQDGFVLINPGAAWPSKRWPPAAFGAVASRVKSELGLSSAISWGPGERSLADAVATLSGGAATVTPPTDIAELAGLSKGATVVLAGDTGPLHLAAAYGTPVVAVYGPSDADRNGPWSEADIVLSRSATCACAEEHRRAGSRGVIVRRCAEPCRCLDDIAIEEVVEAIRHRLHCRSAE